MSRINIQGTINNIKSKSNVYTPIIEAIVNSIQSITHKQKESQSNTFKGKIDITIHRDQTLAFDTQIPKIHSISITDNGTGFNNKNRESFDTFYSEHKKNIGGKGYGRFMFIKYFNNVSVESVFFDENSSFKKREFNFGKQYEIIVDEKISTTNNIETYSCITLKHLYETHSFDKNLDTIAKKLLEKLLIYFINDTFECPIITIKEADSSDSIILNNYLKNGSDIKFISNIEFELQQNSLKEKFNGKVFKIYSPRNQKSKIILTGHNRAVTESNLHKHIPEFEDEFYDNQEDKTNKRNYIVKTYILGDYLDNNVSLEREHFDFGKDKSDSYYPFCQHEIEYKAALKTVELFPDDVSSRKEKKETKINDYVNNSAPWHKQYIKDLDLNSVSYNLTDLDIEIALHKVKHAKEIEVRTKFNHFFDVTIPQEEKPSMTKIISDISEIGKTDLAHYVFNRKCILKAMKEILKRKEDGSSHLEEEIHNLIYPMRKNSEDTPYEDHNLWILDERLVFSNFISSDEKISSKKDALDEPDLVVFDQKKSFRNGENEFSNPLTIFEFKRPKRKNYQDKDDPVLQIGKYVKKIREGKYEMPDGLEVIKVNDNTPVYGYVIADITDKIKDFATNHQLVPSPDGEGYFGYHSGYKIYLEIISFKKLLNDATQRNKIFFQKLQIE